MAEDYAVRLDKHDRTLEELDRELKESRIQFNHDMSGLTKNIYDVTGQLTGLTTALNGLTGEVRRSADANACIIAEMNKELGRVRDDHAELSVKVAELAGHAEADRAIVAEREMRFSRLTSRTQATILCVGGGILYFVLSLLRDYVSTLVVHGH